MSGLGIVHIPVFVLVVFTEELWAPCIGLDRRLQELHIFLAIDFEDNAVGSRSDGRSAAEAATAAEAAAETPAKPAATAWPTSTSRPSGWKISRGRTPATRRRR